MPGSLVLELDGTTGHKKIAPQLIIRVAMSPYTQALKWELLGFILEKRLLP
jgi:hypothetical protein